MLPIVDYHLHTSLCGHATGAPEEYVDHAIAVGLREIGFSDHAPLVTRRAPHLTMDFDQLPRYQRTVETLQKRFDRIAIRVGIEADFIPGYEEKIKAVLDGYPYDYVIGSVHFIDEWSFDSPEEREQWIREDVNIVYRKYYQLLRRCAQSKLFDIMGHVDLVKKFGHRASDDMSGEVKKTADVFKATGMVIEINSSGLRKPVKEIYPTLEALKIYAAAGVPVTFGSDAHQPSEVGYAFDKAAALARDAGYQEYAVFEKRKIVRFEKLQ